jgi:hypothetical protein
MMYDCLKFCAGKALEYKDLVLQQGSIPKLIFVGSAITVLSMAAYSLFRGDSKDEPKPNADSEKAPKPCEEERSKQERQGKKKPKLKVQEKRFYTEEEEYSESASTSNLREGKSTRRSKGKGQRFMSDTDEREVKGSRAVISEQKVEEESDELYFALLSRLNSK